MKIRPKKSLGQNFLQDKEALKKIVAAADLNVGDNVLEIGPGEGALSEELASKCRRLIMIEKDEQLAEETARNLKFQISNFKSNPNHPILNTNKNVVVVGDVLGINIPEIIEQNDYFDYKVVANIPYYITGKIIRLLFETKYQPKLIVLLVQKEVAERICAKPGQMSVLAVTVQHFGRPEIVDIVSKESFDPAPKVDSAILKITPFEKQEELKSEAEEIFRIVKIGFSSRRKTLLNNLSCGLHISKVQAKKHLETCALSDMVRAQDLSVGEWKMLADIVLAQE